jgi:hypothetical protein
MSLFNQASLVVTPNGYKAGKLYSIKPTSGAGDLDVVRATGATRVNASGLIETVANNVPRLDYTGGGCPSILVEPQRTNLLLRSEEFDNATWDVFNGTIVDDAELSPKGDVTADKYIPDNGTSLTSHFLRIQSNIVSKASSSITYTLSVFSKKDEYNSVILGARDTSISNRCRVFFNMDSKTFFSEENLGGFSITNKEFVELIDGWFLVQVTFNSSTSDVVQAMIAFSDSSASTGDGTSGGYLWGAQLEQGANATSYIPTVASAVTRNADVISKTGISDLIGQTEGTLFAEVDISNFPGAGGIHTIIDIISTETSPDRSEIVILKRETSGIRFAVVSLSNSPPSAVIDKNSLSTGVYKLILRYENGLITAFGNGEEWGSVAYSFSFGLPLSRILVGAEFQNLNARRLNDRLKLVTIYKEVLSDQECIDLTTL